MWAAVRNSVEHGLAQLKNWRVLGQACTDPRWVTAPARALLVLTNREVDQWPTIFTAAIPRGAHEYPRPRACQPRDQQLHDTQSARSGRSR